MGWWCTRSIPKLEEVLTRKILGLILFFLTFENSIYNLTLCMTYVTFFIACWKTYTLPDNWAYGTTLLRHVLGMTFISLHIWTSVSIYEVIGDFGW